MNATLSIKVVVVAEADVHPTLLFVKLLPLLLYLYPCIPPTILWWSVYMNRYGGGGLDIILEVVAAAAAAKSPSR